MPITQYHGGVLKRKWQSTEWARRIRDELLTSLGGRCRKCNGARCLTFDHVSPIGWAPETKSWSQRMVEYRRAHQAGNLQILCVRCHGKKSREDQTNLFSNKEPF